MKPEQVDGVEMLRAETPEDLIPYKLICQQPAPGTDVILWAYPHDVTRIICDRIVLEMHVAADVQVHPYQGGFKLRDPGP